MIIITVNRAEYEYDIYGLVQAFYRHEPIEIRYDVTCADRLPYQTRKHALKRETGGDGLPNEGISSLRVTYDSHSFSLEWTGAHAGDSPYKVFEKYPDSWGSDPEKNKNYRLLLKNLLKRDIYKILSKSCGKTLPWGTLTGIRPVKISLDMLERGAGRDRIESKMSDEYLVSKEKTDLSIDIAIREKKILDGIDTKKGVSVYIGIPFCPTTCLYCSFDSMPRYGNDDLVSEYLSALKKEIRWTGEYIKEIGHIDTVYIGGGTPTALTSDELSDLLEYSRSALPMDKALEFTVEAGRPDSITREKLSVMKKCGVTRLSVNPQTMNQKTLDLIGRRHTVEQFTASYYLAREMGFQNINMDLILGLPGENVADVEYTMKRISEMRPDDLTIHSLAIKTKSRLNIEWEKYKNYAMENSTALMDAARNAAESMGLFPYYLYRQKNMIGNLENTGYALPGKEGIYNILIMEEKESIIACGAGTVSKRVPKDTAGSQIRRCDTVRDVRTYIERIEEMIDRKRKLFSKG